MSHYTTKKNYPTLEVDHAVNALETFLTEDAKRGTVSSDQREWLLRRWDVIKTCYGIDMEVEDRGPIGYTDKLDLVEHLHLPIGSYYLPQDYDPKRSSCYDFKAEVEEAYGVKAGLAGIQGDHFCLIWLKPPEDYTYPSGSENKDEVCYYVQPAWDEPSEDNEWKGEWYLEIHPQEDE